MMKSLLFLVSIFLYEVYSTVYVKAPCPNDAIVNNFKPSAYFNGTWYQLARYPNDIERRGDCGILRLTHVDGDRYYFDNKEIINGKVFGINGYFTPAPNTSHTGLVYAHTQLVKDDLVNQSFPLHILATDYNNYAIGYECKYKENIKTRHDYAWIMSRTKKIGASTKAAIDESLKSLSFIDKDKFIWEHFSNNSCKHNATS